MVKGHKTSLNTMPSRNKQYIFIVYLCPQQRNFPLVGASTSNKLSKIDYGIEIK